MLVVPSDHEISTDAQFWETVEAGVPAARSGSIVVFGIKPTRPETGYGYIEVPATGDGRIATSRASSKSPTPKRPQQYVASERFYWNAGIFLFRAEQRCATLSRS